MNEVAAELLNEFVEGWRVGRSEEWLRRRVSELVHEGVPTERVIGAVEFGVDRTAATKVEDLLRDCTDAPPGTLGRSAERMPESAQEDAATDEPHDSRDGGVSDFLRNEFWQPSSIPMIVMGFLAIWWLIGALPWTWDYRWPLWEPLIVMVAIWLPWGLVALAMGQHGRAPGEWMPVIAIGMSVVGIAVLRFPNDILSHGAHPWIVGVEAVGAVLGWFGLATILCALPVWAAVKAFRLNRPGLIFAWTSTAAAIASTYVAIIAP